MNNRERLTYQGSVGALLKSDRRTGEYSGVCLGCRKIPQCTKQQKYCNLFYAIKKLAAYEDTGLTPQEIMDGKMLTGWIPVKERLPEEPAGLIEMEDLQEYIVMIDGAELPTVLLYIGNGEWCTAGVFYKVVAWMPLPEPYRPEPYRPEK